MRVRLLGWLCGFAGLLVLAGCGMPGAPSVPSLNLAKPVEDLTASRKGDQVDLEWTLPRRNTDRTAAKHMVSVRICRHDGTALMSACSQVALATVPPMQQAIKLKKNELPAPIHMHYTDTLPAELGESQPDGVVTYAVEVMNQNDRSAGLSNQVMVPVAPTIPVPSELSAEVNAQGVLLSWTAPAPPPAPPGLSFAYRILRKPYGAPAYVVLGDVEPSASGTYLDKTFAWQTKYQYRITSVTDINVRGTSTAVEGADSKPVEVFTRDIYPPAQPVGLQAVFSSVGQKPFIDLTWAPNMENDLAGYNLFRRVEGGQFQKLNQQLIQTSSYRDDKVEAGKTYIYAVSAVDARGNESPRSTEASEAVPDKW